jgi:CRP/FNR family transcriptional regulator, nitrogen fixation regulation protein
MIVQDNGHIGGVFDDRRNATRIREKVHARLPGRAAGAPGRAMADRNPNILAAFGEAMGATMRFSGNVEIYGAGEPAEYLYQVISGTIRTSRFLIDGRRQIGGFYLRGDIFGLDAGDEHAYSAEAVVDSRVAVIKRSAVIGLAARDAEIARQLWTLTWHELARAQDHMLLLVKSAHERVAGFLLEMASRSPGRDEIELPMLRQDIADYLGLTIETVSRTLTNLETEAAIALPSSRRIVMRNRTALGQMNQ